MNEVNLFSFTESLDKLQSSTKVVVSQGAAPVSRYIKLQTGDLSSVSNSTDAYTLRVDSEHQAVTITGASHTGVFYGCEQLTLRKIYIWMSKSAKNFLPLKKNIVIFFIKIANSIF